MPNRNLWNMNVPRVEYDRRARETRLRLEHIERLLAKRDAVEGFRYLRLLLLLLGNLAGSSRGRGRRTGSPNDRLPCPIATPQPVPVFVRQPAGYPPTIRARQLGGMYY
jgi:hypothetical protein